MLTKKDTFKLKEGQNLDVAIAEKRAYDFLVRQEEAKRWMEEMINEKLPGKTADFVHPTCRDGTFLCRLANIFTNDSIKKIHSVKSGNVLEFMAVDNLTSFLRACKGVGFPEYNFFIIPDIWDKKNVVKVVNCIHALAHYLEKKFPNKYVKLKSLKNAKLEFGSDEIEKTKSEIKGLEDQLPTEVVDVKVETVQEEEDEPVELASPDECTVEGEGVHKAEAGVKNSFTIVSKDSLGNELDHGDETFRVILFKKDDKKVKISANVKDLKNGKYTVSYIPEKAGEYEMEIYLMDIQPDDDEETIEQNKLLLKGFPVTVSVTSSKTSDPNKASLDGIGASLSTAGTESKFILATFDKFGNKGMGGETFTVELNCNDNGTKTTGKVKDLGDGTYEITYICPKTGVYDMTIKNGETVVGSTKKVTVKDAGVSKPELCELTGIKESKLKAGETFTFEINAKDEHGNTRESGGEKFHAQLKNKTTGEEITINLQDSQNGHYSGAQLVTSTGDYELIVSLNDKPLKGSPFSFTVETSDKSDPTKSTARIPPGINTIKAGELQTIVVESRDQYGNLMGKGGETYSVRIANKTKRELYEDKFTCVDKNDGTYELSFTLEEKGEYVIEVLSHQGENADNISGFPIDQVFVVESGVTDPSKSALSGDGLKEAVSKKQSEFTLTTFDKFGNDRTTGGDKVKVVFTDKKKPSNKFEAQVKDNNNGTYLVTYTTEVPVDTEFDTEILVNDTNICKDKPNTLKIKGLKIREIGEDQLSEIHDHDLLSSLINLFKEESNESYIGKIQEIRELMITQIRKNFELESSVKLIEKKIELLIDNRIKAEEAAKSVGFFGRPKPVKKEVKKIDNSSNQTEYSHLFYLLQTEPKYLSKCLFLVPSEKVESFLETVILTLYGYAFSPREEYLILNLFKQTLQLEIERDSKKCGSFLNNNPVLPKMVMTYGRRLQGRNYLQKVLFDKIIDPILKTSKLDVDLNAVKLLKTYLSDKEVETGEKKYKD